MWFEVLFMIVFLSVGAVLSTWKIPTLAKALIVSLATIVCLFAYQEHETLKKGSHCSHRSSDLSFNFSYSPEVNFSYEEADQFSLIEVVNETPEPETMAPTETPLKSYVEIYRYPALDCNPCPLHYIQSFVWSVENECVAASYVSVEHICLIR